MIWYPTQEEKSICLTSESFMEGLMFCVPAVTPEDPENLIIMPTTSLFVFVTSDITIQQDKYLSGLTHNYLKVRQESKHT